MVPPCWVKRKARGPRDESRGKLAAIKERSRGWRERYIRISEEPNKEAMIQDRQQAEKLAEIGVRIVQERRFYLEPAREGQDDTTLVVGK